MSPMRLRLQIPIRPAGFAQGYSIDCLILSNFQNIGPMGDNVRIDKLHSLSLGKQLKVHRLLMLGLPGQ